MVATCSGVAKGGPGRARARPILHIAYNVDIGPAGSTASDQKLEVRKPWERGYRLMAFSLFLSIFE